MTEQKVQGAADVLRAARAIYARSPSHNPGASLPAEGTYCPITAIGATDRGGWEHIEMFRRAAGCPDQISDWNAVHSTDEVLAAFDRAIAEATTT